MATTSDIAVPVPGEGALPAVLVTPDDGTGPGVVVEATGPDDLPTAFAVAGQHHPEDGVAYLAAATTTPTARCRTTGR